MKRGFLSTSAVRIRDLARPGILGIVPYKGGRSVDEMERKYGRRDFLKVASNENPVGPSPLAARALRRAVREAHLYPEQDYPALRGGLAVRYRLRPENVFIGDGTSEIITLTGSAFLRPGDEAVMAYPSFVMHAHATVAAGAHLRSVPLRDWKLDLGAMARAVTKRTRIVWVCNPNNPTGTVVTATEVAGFLRALPGGPLVVFDEAYADFCDDRRFPATLAYVRRGLRVLVLRTFAKLWGLAGLRVGFALGPREVVEVLDRLRQPFNVNMLAYRAACAALRDRAWERRTAALVRTGRRFLARAFTRLGLEPVPSQANFVMVRVGDGPNFAEALIRKGVIVRALGGRVLRDWVRVTVGTPAQNRRVIAAFRAVRGGSGA